MFYVEERLASLPALIGNVTGTLFLPLLWRNLRDGLLRKFVRLRSDFLVVY